MNRSFSNGFWTLFGDAAFSSTLVIRCCRSSKIEILDLSRLDKIV